MQLGEVEATIWCPKCKDVKFTVHRNELREGVYAHVRSGGENASNKTCDKCETNLERKPDG